MVRQWFEPTEGSVGAARRFVADSIADVAAEVRDSVSVMVSELSTNALVHAGSGFEVTVDRSDRHVFVSVGDGGDGTPLLQSPDASEPHGRGLRIVDALSSEWGVSSPSGSGKTVWFRMTLDFPVHGTSTDVTASAAVAEGGTTMATGGDPSPAHPPGRPATADGADARSRASRHRGPRRGTRVTSGTSVARAVTSGP